MSIQKNSRIDGSTKFTMSSTELSRMSNPEQSRRTRPEQSRRIDLSISIVSFNTKSLLEQCLYSILGNSENLNLEIFVVDNGSQDGTPAMVEGKFPQVKLIKNSKNLFFSKANNQTLKKARGKFVLILNSDTILSSSALEKMFEFMEKHPNVAAASCREVDENGKLDQTCSRFPTPLIEFFESNLIGKLFKNQKLLSNYRYGNWKRDTIKPVDVIPGSFLLARTEILKKFGGFDENLLLFYSDNDLCLRIKRAGYEIYFNSDVTITHFRARTIKKLPTWQLYKISEHDMLYYYKKHFGFFWWLFLWLTFRPNWLYWRIHSLMPR